MVKMIHAYMIFLYFLSLPACAVERFSFVHLTDTHIAEDEQSQEDLRQVLQDLYHLAERPAFIIVSGDVSDFGQRATLNAYREIMDKSGFPYYSVLGNHDTRWSGLSLQEQETLLLTPQPMSFVYGGAQFLLLNSGLPLQAWGHISPQTVRWLQHNVGRFDASMPRFVVSHHPFMYLEKNYMPENDQLFDFLQEIPLCLYLNGHGHANRTWTINHIRHQMGSATINKREYQVYHISPALVRMQHYKVGQRYPLQEKEMPLIPEKNSGFQIDSIRMDPAQNQISFDLAWPHMPPDSITTWEIRRNQGQWLPVPVDSGLAVHDTLSQWIPGFQHVALRAYMDERTLYQDNAVFEVTQPGTRTLWKRALRSRVQSDLYIDEYLYLATGSGRIMALSPTDGTIVWEQELLGAVRKSLLVTDRTCYAGTSDGVFAALAASDGRILWRRRLNAAINAVAGYIPGYLYIATGLGTIYELDSSTGNELWAFQTGDHIQARPYVTDSELFVGSWDRHFYAIDTQSGSVKWTKEISLSKYFAPATASPTVSGDKVIFIAAAPAEGEPSVYACDRQTGETIWTYPLSAHYSSPLVAGDRVFFGAVSGVFYALDAQNGELLFEFDTGEPLFDSSPVLQDDIVFFSTLFGTIYGIDVHSGYPVYKVQMGQGLNFSTIAVKDRNIYAVDVNGTIYALALSEKP